MRNVSRWVYSLGLLILTGMLIAGFVNVAMGNISISVPSSTDLHRPQLKSLFLGSNVTSANIYIENTGLTISNGLIMGQNNRAGATARNVLIGGGMDNTMDSVEKSGIGGGKGNEINSSFSVIGGGEKNVIIGGEDTANAIAGGLLNKTQSGGTVVGGSGNQVSGLGVVVGGQGNKSLGYGSMVWGTDSLGGNLSFSWNSPIARDYSAIIMANKGILIGTYEPVPGVNLVVDGAVKIGTGMGMLTGNVGEIKMQSGCFYGYDGSRWNVINKKPGDGCPKITCSFGSILLQPGEGIKAYTESYSKNCAQTLQTGYCNRDGTFGSSGVQYYAYCYELTGEIWYAEQPAECGTSNGRAYVNSPVEGLCNHGNPSPITSSNYSFTWTCTNGSSVANCSATRVYSCGDEPVGAGVVLGESTQIYSPSLASWTPVAQGVTPGACQWTCKAGYNVVGNGCEYVGGVINLYPGDLDMYFITDAGAQGHYTLMDRNLGATAYMGEEGKTTGDWYGNYYQWGNNYGFPNQGSVNTSTIRVNTSGYGPGNYYLSAVFITAPTDWSNSTNNNLWGDTTNTSGARQGPCPVDYHVPTTGEFVDVIDNYWKKSANYTSSNIGTQRSLDSLMPFAGWRHWSNANVDQSSFEGDYWLSSHASTTAYASAISSMAIVASYNIDRSYGFSVRCFKNSPNSILTIYPDGGNKAVITVHNGKIRKLGTPTKSGKTFGGWYSDAGFTSQVHEGDLVPSSAELYARWN